MSVAPAPLTGVGEIAAVIVAAGLGWAGLCYREFRGLEDRVGAAIREKERALGRQNGRHFGIVMRGGLLPFMAAYFDNSPAETPPIIALDDLREISAQLMAEPDRAPVLFRRAITRPVTAAVIEKALERLTELAAGVVLLPEMIDASFDLGAYPAQFDDTSRQARYLAFRFLGQGVLLIGWAGSVLGFASGHLDPVVVVLLGGISVIHGFALEVSRRRLESRLRPDPTIGESTQP